ncbi:MAG: flagellar motor switch protein FliG [Nitrospirae bacterium]|nr:flagellar motor switch protein FliG [Nitrospirota bacterium]
MPSLKGHEKAAIMLSYVGEETAAEILKALDKETIGKVTAALAELKTLKKEELQAVLNEIKKSMNEGVVSVGGEDYAKKILSMGLGEEDAEELLESTKHYNPLEKLNSLDTRLIVNFLSGEHPQTAAFVLSLLEPKKSAEVLSELPDDLKADVALRIANMEKIPEEALKEIEEVLKTQFTISESKGRRVDGLKTVADILNNAAKETEQTILELIEEQEPGRAEAIRSLMFVFDDLAAIDDKGIQAILKEISTNDLALALKTASEELKEKIFRNMSKRAVQILKEEIESMGPVRVSDVEKAQQNIVNVARKLEEEGKIIIAGKGEEDLIV